IDSLGPELRRMPAFKALEKTAEILASGYIATAKNRKDSYFDIGSIYNMVSFNPAEGLRLRIGGMTTAKLHDQWFMNAYLAYGCRDRRLKYSFSMIHTFDKKTRHAYESPRNGLTISTMYDVERPGQQYTYMDRDNILLSYDRDTTAAAAQYVRRTKVHYQREWPSRLRLETWLQYENNEAAGSLAYWRINRDGSVTRVKDFNNLEWSVRLRWAPGETTIDRQHGDKKPFKLSKDAPVLILTHTFGILSGDLQYNKTDLSVEKRFWLSAFGHIDATLQAGIVWDAVPYTKLYIPQNSQSLFMMPNTFCLMKPMEFLMDKYVALYATYYLKGLIFNRIPYWNRLNLREVVSFSGIYGGLSPKNIPGPNTPGLYLLPDGCGQLGKVPYMEITAGIENIFEFLRIDYVRRISYAKNLKGWDKNGIRFTFRVSF
ncbi:MAG: carboxypeptidase-like regulatory domain-containing protein, partial [Bacteroidales bacterium]|nr:carboxypeptidase-like regulatory domain-containing protein [Bacteroidales bacterium]